MISPPATLPFYSTTYLPSTSPFSITIFPWQCHPLLCHHFMVNNLPLPCCHFTSKCGIFYQRIFNVETCLFIFANCYCINFMLLSLFVEFINLIQMLHCTKKRVYKVSKNSMPKLYQITATKKVVIGIP